MDTLVKEGSIGSVLFKSRIISEADIRQALAEQEATGCRFGEALLRLGIVTQEDIDWALSNQLNIPYVRLKKELIDPDAVALVPADMARRYVLVPIIRVADELSIAMADPLNTHAIEAVEKATGCTVSVSVGLIREIREMLDALYGEQAAKETLGFSSEALSVEEVDTIDCDVSGARLLDHLLETSSRRDFQSVTFQPCGEVVRITARHGRHTLDVGKLPIGRFPELAGSIRGMSGLTAPREEIVRGEATWKAAERNLRFQVLILPTMEGDLITLRFDRAGNFPDSIEAMQLSLPQDMALKTILSAGSGLVLLGSREGEERRRLVDLFLDLHDTTGKTVIMSGGLGRGEKTFTRLQGGLLPRDTAAQIHAVMEHGPDIIAVEQLDDAASFLAAVRAALQGKLVVAGVAWRDTIEAVTHLASLQYRDQFLTDVLRGFVGCSSVMTLCPRCKEQVEPSPAQALFLGSTGAGGLFRPAGCDSCNQTGFGGRQYLFEVVVLGNDARDLLPSAPGDGAVMELFDQRGDKPIRKQVEELLQAGLISHEEFTSSIL